MNYGHSLKTSAHLTSLMQVLRLQTINNFGDTVDLLRTDAAIRWLLPEQTKLHSNTVHNSSVVMYC